MDRYGGGLVGSDGSAGCLGWFAGGVVCSDGWLGMLLHLLTLN